MPQLVKLSLLIKRKEGVTPEYFHKYWSEDHAKVVMSLPIAQRVLVKYNQFHVDAEQLAALSAVTAPAPWDGVAEFWARSYGDLASFISDPEFFDKVYPDAEKFVDTGVLQVLIGYEEVKHEVALI